MMLLGIPLTPLTPHVPVSDTSLSIDETENVAIPGSTQDPSVIEQNVDLDSNPDPQVTGSVRMGKDIVPMSLVELQSLMTAQLVLAITTIKSWTTGTQATFQGVANGVMQADGHIGGSFPTPESIAFRPL